MNRKAFIELISFVFVTLFIYTGSTKLLLHEVFLSQTGQSFLLYHLAEEISWGIPSIELLIAFLLIIPRTKQAGFYAATGLMILFTFYVATLLLFAPELPCSCGGIIESLGWGEHLILNIVLVALSVTGIYLCRLRDGATSKMAAR